MRHEIQLRNDPIAESLNFMKFSEEFEARFAEMVPHYPTKRSALVPTLLYAQDEVGFVRMKSSRNSQRASISPNSKCGT